MPGEELLDRIAGELAGVTAGTMFRRPGLRTGGKVFAFLGHDGQLIAKLPRARAEELVEAGTAELVVMGKRTMREWVAFPAGGDDVLVLWREVAREARRYVDSLC